MQSLLPKDTLLRTYLKAFINDTVYVKRVYFTIVNYENDIFSLFETSDAFIHALCHSKMHFHQRRPLELINRMLKSFHVLLGLSPVWNSYPKGSKQ